MIVLAIEATENIEYQGPIMDDFTKVTKSSGHTFHLAAVIIDRKIALDEHAELRIKVESTSFAVAQELLFDAGPGGAPRVAMDTNRVLELDSDSTEQPRVEATLHPALGWYVRRGTSESTSYSRA